jgi:hypothetical protein
MVTGKGKLLIRPTMPAHDTTMSVDHQDLGGWPNPTIAAIAVGR